MFRTEWSTAQHIKDRINRKYVQRILKKIIEYLSTLKSIPENGLFIFAGIDSDEQEVFHTVISPFPSRLNYYRCDNKFHYWMIADFFKQNRGKGLLIFINGEEAIIYQIENEVTLVSKIESSLIKRHSKGGQSSIRFARLAEESRHHYVESVRTELENKCKDKNTRLIVSGSRELSEQFVKLLIKKSWTNVDYTEKWLNFRSNTFKQESKEIIEYFDQDLANKDEKVIAELLERIAYDHKIVGFPEVTKGEVTKGEVTKGEAEWGEAEWGEVTKGETEWEPRPRRIEKIIHIEDRELQLEWTKDNPTIFRVKRSSKLYERILKYGGVIFWFV